MSSHVGAVPFSPRSQVTFSPRSQVPFSPHLQYHFDSHAIANRQAAVVPTVQKEVPQRATVPAVYTVTLSGIPPKLCNDACLDAILWASGVQRSTLRYQSKKNGHVVIDFQTLDAATECVNHFRACSWSTGKLHVEVVHSNQSQIVDTAKCSHREKHSGYARPFGRRFSGSY